jgi:glutamyl-tRNA reductase
VNELRVIAITHKNFPLDIIGKFHLAPEKRSNVLGALKNTFGFDEIMYLSTCNRVEIVFTLPHYVCPGITASIMREIQPELSESDIQEIALKAERYNGTEAAEHLLRVASSIDSIVIGEREIITQLRKAYEECSDAGLTGDDIRLVISQCIKTAKEVFTNTDLARKPVSVVSLAWQQFREFGLHVDSRVLLAGAGQIISNFAKFLQENGYSRVTVANRSAEGAARIASLFDNNFITLDELPHYTGGFDALITCTAADHAIIKTDLYTSLLQGEKELKLVIDLAIPADVDHEVMTHHHVRYVDMNIIREKASHNLQFREQALTDCRPIIESGLNEFAKNWQSRQIERAMQSIPATIKEIRSTALGSVFAKDLENLDDESRQLLEKIMNYMEKKYISIPMKMAKDVLLNEVSKN